MRECVRQARSARLRMRRQKGSFLDQAAVGLLLVAAICSVGHLGVLLRHLRDPGERSAGRRAPSPAELQLFFQEHTDRGGIPSLCAAAETLCIDGYSRVNRVHDWRRAAGYQRAKPAGACPLTKHARLLNASSMRSSPGASAPRTPAHGPADKVFGSAVTEKCAPITMFVEDAAIKWFGAPGWLTAEALHECEPECVLAQGSASAHSADVVLLNLSPVLSPIKVLPGQLSMVLNLEAHSLSERALAATDLLVSFHPESDVPVTYAYALLQASPCRHSNRTAACLERGDEWCAVCRAEARTKGEGRRDRRKNRGAEAFLWATMDYIPALQRRHQQLYETGSWGQTGSLAVGFGEGHGVGQRKQGLVATFVSATCQRHNDFLGELMQHIHVDSYGRCYQNREERGHAAFKLLAASENPQQRETCHDPRTGCLPLDSNQAKMLIASTYKFLLSIENSIVPDYVTEKFYQGFMTPTVMVYLGAPNAHVYAPANHSFIDALDFESPKALADFLILVASNSSLYNSYTSWRQVNLFCVHVRLRRCSWCARIELTCTLLVTLAISLLGNRNRNCTRDLSVPAKQTCRSWMRIQCCVGRVALPPNACVLPTA